MARCGRSACGRWRPDALVRHARVGVVFNETWYCSSRCLEIETQLALGETRYAPGWVPQPPVPRVGRLLLHRQLLSEETLETALRAQRDTGRRVGAELVAMGAVSSEDLLRALAAQAGVGCVAQLDTARVAAGVGSISRATVRALGVVPFEVNTGQQRLRVACASPLPRPALAALREITGWLVEPFLVPDSLLQRLLEAYGSARAGTEAAPSAPVRTVSDAAARIARAAERRHADRMQRVRCDPYVWVRLQGDSYAEDLLVALDHHPEEASWQAAPTRH